MQINDLVQNKNNIKIFEDFTNFELEMAKIPDKYKVDADLTDDTETSGLVYRWNKKNQNWDFNIKGSKEDTWKSRFWTPLQPEPSEDDEGNPFLDKNGKQQYTKYTRRWRHYVEKAGREIDQKKDNARPATDTKPIPNEKEFTYPKNGNDTYVFDNIKNAWFKKGTKIYVDKNSLLNATLMAQFGFKPDGETELDPTSKERFLNWVSTKLPPFLAKGGKLGQDSQVSARNFGGRQGGKLGDLLGRILISNGKLPNAITNMFFGPEKQVGGDDEEGNDGPKAGDQRPPKHEPTYKPGTDINPYNVDSMELRQRINFAVRNEKTNTRLNTQTGSNEYIDPYKMMDLKRDATDEEIKQRWKILSQMYHPDKGQDGETFKRINSAYKQIKLMKPGIK